MLPGLSSGVRQPVAGEPLDELRHRADGHTAQVGASELHDPADVLGADPVAELVGEPTDRQVDRVVGERAQNSGVRQRGPSLQCRSE